MLEYETVENGDAVRVGLAGELAGQVWTERLQRLLEHHFINDGVKTIRINLESVSYMNTSGVATLLRLYNESKRRGKRLIVEGAKGRIREKLRLAGVLDVLAPDEPT